MNDDDTCAYCWHPVDEHGPAGCEYVVILESTDVDTGDGRLERVPVLKGICPCSEHPAPYDPSDP